MAFAKVLLAENATAYTNAVSQLTAKMQPLQQALAAYAALGVATVPTTADLADLWSNPQVFLERMLTTGQPVTLGNGGGVLDVAPGQVYGLLKKPAGADAFILAVGQLRATGGPWFGGVATDAYELVGGVLQIKQAELDKALEGSRIYATTQAQKDEFDRAQTVANTLEAIRQNGKFGTNFHPLEYLKDALRNDALQFNDQNPVTVNAAYFVRTARLQG